jgi:environmental stress-induced protein Ves
MALDARVIRFADYPVNRWKNGRGETRELATGGVRPDGTFGWRLSMADISVDAPFSDYPGIERHLGVVAGGPLELVVAGEAHRIEVGGTAVTFAGDAVVSARPIDGTVTDLNLMVDDLEWLGSLEAVSSATVLPPSPMAMLVSIQDGLTIALTDVAGVVNEFELDALDCVLAQGAASITIENARGRTYAETVAMLVRVRQRGI